MLCLLVLVLDPVEGFNVFKTSNSEAVSEEKNSAVIDSEGKKELYRQMEVQSLSQTHAHTTLCELLLFC